MTAYFALLVLGGLCLYGIGALLGAPDLPPRREPPPSAEPTAPARNETDHDA